MGRLQDKVALITGGARGIGAETAALFAAQGATVVITDVLDDVGETTAATNDRIGYRHLDVRSEDGWRAVVTAVVKEYGRLDVLVNNAGVDLRKKLSATTLADFERLISINQIGTFLGMQAASGASIAAEAPCSIVNISSVAGLEGVQNHAAYSATKFAVTGLTKAAAKEWGRYGIRVNSVHPGIIVTPMTDDQFADPDIRAGVERNLPLRRLGQPIDIANMVAFLASDESSYCTGQAFTVDGGVHP
ncbi:MAG: 3alpha(or 20beta)-hydroxysteroid dehydrogenase [Ilumatobacter sp.]